MHGSEFRNRPKSYIRMMVKHSKGFMEFINEENSELKLTKEFFHQMRHWFRMYNGTDEFTEDDKELSEQGIYLQDDLIRFDCNLNYSKFFKLISDESEGMNDPNSWEYSEENLPNYKHIDFSDKKNPLFNSKLVLLKFYVLRKIDEVAFVTSRYVHCPACNSSYSVPASRVEFVSTFKCDKMRASGKPCNTALKKFPARKMIPTYIYEIAIEVKSKQGVEFKEFFLESFQELEPGFHTGMVFGRTEAKSNSFYFTGLKSKREESQHKFKIVRTGRHVLHDIIDSIFIYMNNIGFVLDNKKARLVFYIETIKKILVTFNKELNLDHSLYFGAPGIGKTVALTLLHYMFYSNTGLISGPRFSIPGLTGGQKEVYYQDVSKKKNVPGLFSNQAFIFDEINNEQFLTEDKAVNLVKSVALAPSGTSSTVGGKEFLRTALIAASANYDPNVLRYYENRIKKMYREEMKKQKKIVPQENMLFSQENSLFSEDKTEGMPDDFDFYLPIKKYKVEVPKELKLATVKVRESGKHYLTAFPNALMERFYWTILIHPKYDKKLYKEKEITVDDYLKKSRNRYSQRELYAQLFSSHFEQEINDLMNSTIIRFKTGNTKREWNDNAQVFLRKVIKRYRYFFGMFGRINQVTVNFLFVLSLVNCETELSYKTKRIFERMISLLHTPSKLEDFHDPDFEKFEYIGESRFDLLNTIKEHPNEDIRKFVDYDNRKIVRVNLTKLQNRNKITKIDEFKFKANLKPEFGEEL